ncbi:MAG: 5'-nucleotidase C-terminal domain-containing protein [Pseudomonadota bacterium]
MSRIRLVPAVFALSSLAATLAQAGTVTFLHFNDLHAHLTSHADLVSETAGQPGAAAHLAERGGLARLATLIKQQRLAYPDSVLMNIGDTYHGGVEALYTNGNAIVDPVDALGVDIGVPGNWDFAYGPAVTRLRYGSPNAREKRMLQAAAGMAIKRPAFTNLGGNVTLTAGSQAGQPLMPATKMMTVDGVRVGFIGITSDIVPEMHAMLAAGMNFLAGETAYRDYVNTHSAALRADGAQLVVVMSELGVHKDARLADVIQPGSVDVFFSAHTHEAIFEPLVGKSGARVVEAGNDGWLGRMRVTVESGKPPSYEWAMLPVTPDLAEDAATKALVDTARAPFVADADRDGKLDAPIALPNRALSMTLDQPIDAVAGHVNAPLDRRNALESSFNAAWSEALRGYAGTELALTPGFRFDAVVAPGAAYEDGHVAGGDLTVEDIYRYFPVPYTLATGMVSGARLKEVIDANLTGVFSHDAFAQHGGWTDGWAGLNIKADLAAADGTRVEAMTRPDGSAISASGSLSIAGCQRPMDDADVLCSYGGFTDVTPLNNPETGQPWTVQALFGALLAEGRITAPVQPQVTDASATPLWPAQQAVQPLLANITAKVKISAGRLTYHRDTGQYSGTISVSNPGDKAITAPLKLVLADLGPAVRLGNAEGSLYGQPFLRLPALPPGGSVTLKLVFDVPARKAISYQPQVWNGGV